VFSHAGLEIHALLFSTIWSSVGRKQRLRF